MEKEPITVNGLKDLKSELEDLKNVQRPKVVEAIAEARSHGDLKENAEYHAAKERQGMIEARVNELETKIALAEVIDISNLTGDRIQFGAIVTLVDEETDKQSTDQIVGADEAEVNEGRLSIASPLARSLIGKQVGEAIEITTPNGVHGYEILEIKFG